MKVSANLYLDCEQNKRIARYVVNEIQELKTNYGITDIFTVDRKTHGHNCDVIVLCKNTHEVIRDLASMVKGIAGVSDVKYKTYFGGF